MRRLCLATANAVRHTLRRNPFRASRLLSSSQFPVQMSWAPDRNLRRTITLCSRVRRTIADVRQSGQKNPHPVAKSAIEWGLCKVFRATIPPLLLFPRLPECQTRRPSFPDPLCDLCLSLLPAKWKRSYFRAAPPFFRTRRDAPCQSRPSRSA